MVEQPQIQDHINIAYDKGIALKANCFGALRLQSVTMKISELPGDFEIMNQKWRLRYLNQIFELIQESSNAVDESIQQ